MNASRNTPDPEGLAIAREIQERVHPAEVILGGSRAGGDHRPDSDVDLTAVAPDEAVASGRRRYSGISWRGSATCRWSTS